MATGSILGSIVFIIIIYWKGRLNQEVGNAANE